MDDAPAEPSGPEGEPDPEGEAALELEADGDGDRDDDGAPFIDDDTPWEQDLNAQVVVAMHPQGLNLDEIGWLNGVSRERVRQLEERALRMLLKRNRAVALELLGELHARERGDNDEHETPGFRLVG